MSYNEQNEKSCMVAAPKTCNTATQAKNHATADETSMQLSKPLSLKQLAARVLARSQCNTDCNLSAMNQKRLCNFGPEKNLQKLHANHEELQSVAAEDWEELRQHPEQLEAFADAIYKRKLMEQGKVPEDFTALTTCQNCGTVPVHPAIANGDNVLGCPWCWNKAYGFPIPNFSSNIV